MTVNYEISPDSMVYANFGRGYRPGGFNANLTTLTPADLAQIAGAGSGISFKQEKLDNYEIGHKGTWFDNRLRTTLALYYMQWRNGQFRNTQFYTDAAGSLLFQVIRYEPKKFRQRRPDGNVSHIEACEATELITSTASVP